MPLCVCLSSPANFLPTYLSTHIFLQRNHTAEQQLDVLK